MQKVENQGKAFRQTQDALAVYILKHFLQVQPHKRQEWGKIACEIIQLIFKEPHIFTLSLPSTRKSASKNQDHSQPFTSLELISSDIRRQLNNSSTHTICFFRRQTELFMKIMRIIAYKDNERPETYISSITRLADANPTLFCRALAEAQPFHYQGNEKEVEHLTWWLISRVQTEAIKLTNKQFSELLCLNGHLNYLLNRIDEAYSKIKESKLKNGRNTKASRQSLKISIRRGDFSGCIWQERLLWQYSTTKNRQFQVIKSVAQFLTKGGGQVWKDITDIKEELQVFPDRQGRYLDANFSLGLLHFLLCDDSTALKYFAKEYHVNKNDISLVRLMGLSRYRTKDYASAMEYFNRVRELRPDLANDNELLWTMVCCLKAESKDAAMQMMPLIEERAHCCSNMKYTWPYSLYLGILYHLGEDFKAIQCYNRLELKYTNDFQIVQRKIVVMLCHHRRGEDQRVMELLEDIQAIQARLQLHKIPISNHYIHSKQLIFLANYCKTNQLHQLELTFSQSIAKLINYAHQTYGVSSMIEPLIQRREDIEIHFICQ